MSNIFLHFLFQMDKHELDNLRTDSETKEVTERDENKARNQQEIDSNCNKVKETLKTDIGENKARNQQEIDSSCNKVKETLKIDSDENKARNQQEIDSNCNKVKETLKTDSGENKARNQQEKDSSCNKVKETLKTHSGGRKARNQQEIDSRCNKVKETLKTDSGGKKARSQQEIDSSCNKVNKTLKTDSGENKARSQQEIDSSCNKVKETMKTDSGEKKARNQQEIDSSCNKVKETLKTDSAGKKTRNQQEIESSCNKVKETLKTDSGGKKTRNQQEIDRSCNKLKMTLKTDSGENKTRNQQEIDSSCNKVKETLKTDSGKKKARNQQEIDSSCNKVKETLKTDSGEKKARNQQKIESSCNKVKETLKTDSGEKKARNQQEIDSSCYKVKETLKTESGENKARSQQEIDSSCNKVKETLKTDSGEKKTRNQQEIDSSCYKVKETLKTDSGEKKARNQQEIDSSCNKVEENLKTDSGEKKARNQQEIDSSSNKVKETLKTDSGGKKTRNQEEIESSCNKAKETLKTDSGGKKTRNQQEIDSSCNKVKETLKTDSGKRKDRNQQEIDSSRNKVKETLKIDSGEKKARNQQEIDSSCNKVKETLKTDSGKRKDRNQQEIDSSRNKVKETLKIDSGEKKARNQQKIESSCNKVKETLKTDSGKKKARNQQEIDSSCNKVKETLKTDSGEKKARNQQEIDSSCNKVKETLKTDSGEKKTRNQQEIDSSCYKVKETLKTDSGENKARNQQEIDSSCNKVEENLKTDSGEKKARNQQEIDSSSNKVKETLKTDSGGKKTRNQEEIESSCNKAKETLKTDSGGKKTRNQQKIDSNCNKVKETLKTDSGKRKDRNQQEIDSSRNKVKETLKIDSGEKKARNQQEIDRSCNKVKETLKTDIDEKKARNQQEIDSRCNKVKETLKTGGGEKKARNQQEIDRSCYKVKETLKIDRVEKKERNQQEIDSSCNIVKKAMNSDSGKTAINTDVCKENMNLVPCTTISNELLDTDNKPETETIEKKTNGEIKNFKQDSSEKNTHLLQMVLSTKDTFQMSDSFVAIPIESACEQGSSSFHSSVDQNLPGDLSSEMYEIDPQEASVVREGWNWLIKQVSDARLYNTGSELELIKPFDNQIFNMDVVSVNSNKQKICESDKTLVSESYELHENHSLICTENTGHADKTVVKKMKHSDKTDECKNIMAMDACLTNETGRETENVYNEIKTSVKSENTDRQTAKNGALDRTKYKDDKQTVFIETPVNLLVDQSTKTKQSLNLKKSMDTLNIEVSDCQTLNQNENVNRQEDVLKSGKSHQEHCIRNDTSELNPILKSDVQNYTKSQATDMDKSEQQINEITTKQRMIDLKNPISAFADSTLIYLELERQRKWSELKTKKKDIKIPEKIKAKEKANVNEKNEFGDLIEEKNGKTELQEYVSELKKKARQGKQQLSVKKIQAKDRQKTEKQRKQKLCMAKSRLNLTEEKKAEIREKDRKRKADLHKQQTESEIKERKRKQKLAKAKSRLKLTEDEKAEILAQDRKRKADLHKLQNECEIKERKRKQKLAMVKNRLKLAVDEKAEILAQDRKRKADLHKLQNECEIKERQRKQKLAMVKNRLKLAVDEKAEIKAQDRKRKADLNECLTGFQIKENQRKKTLAMAKSRLKLAEDKKAEIKTKDRKRKADLNERLTGFQIKENQRKKTLAMAKRRLKLAEDEKVEIKTKDRKRKAKGQLELDQPMKIKKRIQERSRKQQIRSSLSGTESTAVQTFRALVKEGPVFVCTSCHRLMYRENVTIFNKLDYNKCDETLLNRCVSGYLHSDNREYICQTCQWNLKRNKLPAQSIGNALQLDPIPDELQNLSALESMLISKRVPFMKVLALPRGKQRAIHGCVINVPINPEETYSVLPRLPSSSSMITVKLKRKLQYRGHVIKQSVRPWRVLQALYHLKHTVKNPHYSDIEINEHWDEDAARDNDELWSSMTANEETAEENTFCIKPADVDKMEESTEDSNDSDQEEENHDEDDTAQLRGLPFDSCLEPKDMSSDQDLLLSIAPGEGKKPLSLYSDKNNEELAFPTLFPNGRFGWEYKRDQKLSLKKYFNSRLLNVDGRFSQSTEYLFYAQYRCEAEDVGNSLSIALRKCKGKAKNITAGQIKDAEEIRKLIRNDLNIHFLQKVRGSPAYYNKLLLDLLGMVRQLGNCTWFLTLSAADLKWTDTIQIIAAQNGQHLSDQDVENLTWEQKCMWLRTNPVTAARHFDHRLQTFMKMIILGNSHPIGQIKDFKYRIEFQQRGSPHAHMLIWIKDAPQVKGSDEKDVSQFVDKYITCSVPTDDDELAELVKTVQKHSHSSACRKPGKSCRFSFPRPPLDETTVLYPPEEPTTEQAKTIYSDTLTAVYDKLSSLEPDTDPSLAELLDDMQVPLNLYMKALQWIKTKQGRPAVLIKRKPKEGCINFYNPVLLKAWQANMDIQIVDHVESCIMYVSSYISKPEKTLGDVLKSVSKTCEPQGPKQMMKMVSKKFLSHREVSAQEAVYRVLSLPLIRGSRQVIFVPTDLPENRTKLLKPLKIIKELDDDDEDLYMTGMLDKYADRPNTVENLCLADFAALYSYGEQPRESELKALSASEDEEDPTLEGLDDIPKTIQLRTTKRKLRRRSKPAIIRTHQFSQQGQEEEFYHSKLLLYLPWRNENALQGGDGTYKSNFIAKLQEFSPKMAEYEPNAEEYERAVQNLMENGPPEDAWATLAAQTEQERSEDRLQGPTDDPDFSAIAPPEDAQPTDLGLQHAEYDHELSSVTTQEWLNMILSLNEEQKPVHQFVLEWCTKMSLTYKTTQRPDPFHLFLTGGAGVGKSHVIKTIVQTVRRRLNVGQSEDDVTVMVCAYMGSAAFNVDGYTLHSSFHLPLNEKKNDDYIRLSNEQLSTMRSKLGNLCLLIIDEISMVGSDQLLAIHRRLAEIMNSDEPFGGVSVLAVGDLYQLPPVGHFPIYTPPSDPLAALYGSLWKKHFKIIELTQIMRQKNDVLFANALNRLRTEEQTEEDIELINTRNVDNLGVPAPPEALHIYALNKDVDAHNEKMLNQLGGQIITIQSIDSKTDHQTGRIDNISLGKKESGLWKEIKVAIGARVMLTKNVDVSDGLANTAMGTVTGFIPPPPASDHPDFSTYRPKYILVHFDEDRVGRRRKQKLKHLIPDGVSVPIAAIEVLAKYKRVCSKRVQFPLALAWAITIHKAQGKTVDKLVVSVDGSFRCGQLYTALSRVKTIDGLYILGEFKANKVKADTRSKEEMERLKLNSPFKVSIPVTVTVSPALFFRMSVININSLKPHFRCLAADQSVMCSDVVTLTETWLRPRDASADFSLPDKLLSRQDSKQTAHGRNGGIATYLSQQYHLVQRYQVDIPQLQHLSLLIQDRVDPAARLLIITVYNPPNTAYGSFLKQLDMLLTRMPCDSVPTVLCGDFNINNLKEDNAPKGLTRVTKYYGFRQYVSTITHRAGAALDHVYVNKDLHHSLMFASIPVPYTDHFHVQIAVPFRALFV